jgi:DNA-binding protein H-NS
MSNLDKFQEVFPELNIAECNELIHFLENKIKAAKKGELANARKQVKQLAESLGVTVEELLPSDGTKKPRAKSNVVYKNPKSDETWNGVGRKPRWIEEIIQAGTDIETLKVKTA